jgi:hypothetical protein
MLMTPSTLSCMVKRNPVVVIGVDRRAVGCDNGARYLLPCSRVSMIGTVSERLWFSPGV